MKQQMISRRELIKRYGIAGILLSPILQSMNLMAASTSFKSAPRFIMFFKGGAFQPSALNVPTINDLAGTPIASLSPHSADIILFKNMHIHGGGIRSTGYQEEHGAGLYGCVTGHQHNYTKNDSYFSYTDYESIDMRIARQYQSIPELQQSLAFSSLHLGGGAHSDSDSTGLGQRFISFRNRLGGDSTYGNAISPIQDVAEVYRMLLERIMLVCKGQSNQPAGMNTELLKSLDQKASLLDFEIARINDAKIQFGIDSEHSIKLDGMLQGLREAEMLAKAQRAAGGGMGGNVSSMACPASAGPTGNGQNKYNCDELSSVHDGMIAMIKLAFTWDLTRVVAFALSGASSGQTWTSQGVKTYHHGLEHANDTVGLNKMGSYYAGKFANLLTALKEIKDNDGNTGLVNSSVILGMECNGADGHTTKNIPFIFAGQGGGKFNTGRIIDAGGRSNNDLLVSVQQAAGISSNVFGLPDLCKGPIL